MRIIILNLVRLSLARYQRVFPETGLLDLQDRTPFWKIKRFSIWTTHFFSHDAITLDQLKSRSVTLRSRKSGKRSSSRF